MPRGLRYYEVLELPLNASEADVRRSYRRLALKWHPDKNPQNKEQAEVKFKEIAEAYEVLSDPDKRKIYDRFGEEGLTAGGGFNRERHHGGGVGGFPGGIHGGFFVFRSPFDVFRDFFDGHDPFQELFGGGDPFADMIHLHQNLNSLFGGPVLNVHNQRPSSSAHQTMLFGPQMNLFSFAQPPTFLLDPFTTQLQTSFSHIGTTPHGFRSSSSLITGNNPLRNNNAMNNIGMKSVSSVTKFVDGKAVVEKRTIENGSETVELFENGRLISRTVDGVIYID